MSVEDCVCVFICVRRYMGVEDGCFVKTATVSIFSLLL